MICYKFDKPLIPSVEELFRECGKDVNFMNNYIINSVLSYIERKEQDLVLGMQYNDWVIIDSSAKDEIKEQIINYITKFAIACNGTNRNKDYLKKVREEVDSNRVVEKALCYLYAFGIYGDCISRYLLIKPPDGDEVPDYEIPGLDNEVVERAKDVFNKCVEKLSKWREYWVRSRFIEIVRDLYLLKQRFPDKSVFESYMLIDRVFAYAYPRNLPLGVYTVSDVCGDGTSTINLKKLTYSFFKSYHDYLIGAVNENIDEEFEEFWEIFCYFLRKAFSDRRFYRFQIRGVETAIKKLLGIFNTSESRGAGKIDYLIIAAPTGSGKTEVMVLTVLIAALARKIILIRHGLDDEKNVPIALMVYPRRSLANDQVSRLIEYLSIINERLKNKLLLTINYTDIRDKREYEDAINSVKVGAKPVPLQLKYGVLASLIKDGENYYVELRFLTCPRRFTSGSGSIYPRFRVVRRGDRYEVDDSVVYCGDNALSFIALTKDRVRERLGDIHITIFETLRHNLFSRSFENLFGICRKAGDNKVVFDYPLIIVLDEIHTYTDIPGVRYTYMLRRVLNRIRYYSENCNGDGLPGNLVIGMSATIPNAGEFLSKLFFSEDIEKNINDYLITVDDEETIPLGNEYFIITVPTRGAPVDALTVSIQTIMNTFYNIPSIPIDSGYVKKGIVFLEEFNVLRRMKRELWNREQGAIYRVVEINNEEVAFGLQDLRNPRNRYFYEVTLEDYGDDAKVVDNIRRGKISRVISARSWLDGELWWGYMLDTIINYYPKNNLSDYVTTRFNRVVEYSSRKRGDLRRADIVVSTSSLEVGVDYSDVVLIYQHGAPPNISSLIQRAGRGGRRLFENPLMRIIVGIQLSPDLPHQSWLFEIFTRVKDLRKAIDYDKLFLPKASEEIMKQVLAELALEYYVLNNGKLTNNWECRLTGWLKKNKENIINYSQWVFANVEKSRLNSFIDEIINYLDKNCRDQSGR